jgi:hypothetical protein
LKKEVNRSRQDPLTLDSTTMIINTNKLIPCSVINL